MHEPPGPPSTAPAPDAAEALFDALVALPPAEQGERLRDAGARDPDLAARVAALLDAHQDDTGFLREDLPTAVERRAASFTPESGGDLIGRYKLLQKIGEGGFGTVWMAEQTEPMVRKVALKIIKVGMDTKEVIGRFEAERQALAMMDHPNIAKVLDAGATRLGRPFFVMELVKGVPITEFCDDRKLDTRRRLALFGDICSAVNHAHQKGVIHRDLKPSNVMVTLHGDKPVVKVIDFGIAKATQGRLTDKTLFTRYEQFIGTPVYMSPEQATLSGLDIDTRSDIYSLGILLYELLTGSPPFDARTLASAGYDEMRRIIREVEPPRPSSRLGTLAGEQRTRLAETRHASLDSLDRLIEPDLDWIVMKAIEKDRSRRYETANGLAMDIERFLENQPVLASPPSATYRFRKFARRNRSVLQAAALVLFLLVTATVVSTWQAIRATRAENRANHTLDELRSTAPAFLAEARSLVERDRLDEALDKIDYALKLVPENPDFLLAKANLHQSQLRLESAAALYREVLRLRPDDPRAKANLPLTEQLLAAGSGEDGGYSSQSLALLHLAMVGEQRPSAEIRPIAMLIGKEGDLLRDYWLGKLRDLPIGSGMSLEERLEFVDTGRFALDLSNTAVADLEPLRGMPLGSLDLTGCANVRRLEPLRGAPLRTLHLEGLSAINDEAIGVLASLSDLHILTLDRTNVTDLSPLRGRELTELSLRETRVSDLSPLAGMAIENLDLAGSPVSSLDPIKGMPLRTLDLTQVPALDFDPLRGLPLRILMLQNVRIEDLRVLEGMPLETLALWGCNDARHYESLLTLPNLTVLVLPESSASLPDADLRAIDALDNHSSLKQLSDEIMNEMFIDTTPPKELFFAIWRQRRELQKRLTEADLKFEVWRTSPRGIGVKINSEEFEDLSVLEGLPIEDLTIARTKVRDLSSLRGIPLKSLTAWDTQISDLAPLTGMPLEFINLGHAPVSDLSPLQQVPLIDLRLGDCVEIRDLAPLAKIRTLTSLILPPAAENLEILRSLPQLRRVSFVEDSSNGYRPGMTAEEFWASLDQPLWIRNYLAGGFKPERAEQEPSRAANLLALQTWYGKEEEREALSRRLLALRETLEEPNLLSTVVTFSCLAPINDPQWAREALEAADQGARLAEERKEKWAWTPMATALANYRAGNPTECLNALDTALARAKAELSEEKLFRITQLVSYYRALCLADQGSTVEARDAFLVAEAELRPEPTPPANGALWVSPDRDDLAIWLAYRECAAKLGLDPLRKTKSFERLAARVRADPADTLHALRLGTYQLWHGQYEEHLATCRTLLERAEAIPDEPWGVERAAKTFFLARNPDPGLLAGMLACARLAANSPADGQIQWCQLTLGTAELRCGNLDAAESAFQAAISAAGAEWFSPQMRRIMTGTCQLFLASISAEKGDASTARALFEQGSADMPPLPASHADPIPDNLDQDTVIWWMAFEEAKEAVGQARETPGPPRE